MGACISIHVQGNLADLLIIRDRHDYIVGASEGVRHAHPRDRWCRDVIADRDSDRRRRVQALGIPRDRGEIHGTIRKRERVPICIIVIARVIRGGILPIIKLAPIYQDHRALEHHVIRKGDIKING